MLIETKLPLPYIFKKTWKNLLFISLLSITNYIISVLYELPNVPIAIPALLGTAISLVLAFKLGQSYDRWWEARKIWGAVVNDSRSLVIQLRNFTISAPQNETALIKNRMHSRQMAWPYALGNTLRRLDPFEYLEPMLTNEEFTKLKNHQNIPLALLDFHSKDINELHQKGYINDYQQIQLDKTIVRLCDSMGKAERIKNTVFPTTYRLYLHFFIILFLGILSFSLAELEGVWQPIVVILISLPFLLLEKTANHLQDPFENRPTDISVTAIARTIEINLRQLNDEENIPEPFADQGYYIM